MSVTKLNMTENLHFSTEKGRLGHEWILTRVFKVRDEFLFFFMKEKRRYVTMTNDKN
jgi:hypothetical protein